MAADPNSQPALARLKSKLLNSPRASNGKLPGTDLFHPGGIMPQARALNHKLIQFNGPAYISYILLDLDYQNAGMAWIDAIGVPRPTLVMVNPTNGHAHYAYELTCPVRRDNKRSLDYCMAIRAALIKALKADRSYAAVLAKNPFHPAWQVNTHDRHYTLTELAEHLDLPTRHSQSSASEAMQQEGKQPRLIEASDSRTVSLFDGLRVWAYANVAQHSSLHSLASAIDFQAGLMNDQLSGTRKGMLSLNAIRKLVKSISRWTWKKYQEGSFSEFYDKRNRGVMGLPATMALRARQQAGQDYTSGKRVDKTGSKIQDAIVQLQRAGRPITKSAVSRLTGLSRNTVSSHWTSDPILSSSPVTEPPNSPIVLSLPVSSLSSVVDPTDLPISGPVTFPFPLPVACSVNEAPVGAKLSQGAGAQVEGVTTHPTEHPLTYQQIVEQHADEPPIRGQLKAYQYAQRMAREHGIVIDGLPRSIRSTLEEMTR